MTTPTPPAEGVEAPAKRPRLLVRLLAPLLLLGFSGLLAMALGEVAVRVAAPQQLILMRPDLWQPVDTLGWMLRPGVTTTINTGERTVDVLTDQEGFRVGHEGRHEAESQVLVIGDSFAEAIQVEYEQSYSHLLEQGLRQATGRDLVVRAAGVSDWSPNHYLLRARQLLARDRYDLLVVTLFVGNDAILERVDHFPPRAPVERYSLRLPRALSRGEFIDAFARPVNDALEQRSHLFVLLKNQFAGLRMRLGITADYLPLEFRREEATSPRWSITTELVRDIAATAAAHDVPVLFVLIPERIQVYEEDFERYLTGFGIERSLVDLDQPSVRLREGIMADSLTVLDALEPFRAAAAGGPKLFGSVDQHLSPEGHVLLAELMTPLAAEQMARR